MRRSRVVPLLVGAAIAMTAACGLGVEGTLSPDERDSATPLLDASVEATNDVVAAYASTDHDAGPVDAALFDADAGEAGDAGTADASDAEAGTALAFDGTNDFVRVLRQVQDDFTLEAWINTATSRTGSNFFDGLGVIYADVPGSANDFGTSILNGRFAFGTVDNTILSTTTVTSGAWVHVAAVRIRSSGTMRVVVNGTAETTTTGNSTATLTAPANVDVGGNTLDARYFKGKIDEVRIWNLPRTTTEIAATMKSRLVGNEIGLVGYWRFDDGSGASAIDSSASGNKGTLGNGDASARPLWVPSGAF